MKKSILLFLLMSLAPSAFAGEYALTRSATSSDTCFDFLFGIGGETQGLIKTVDVTVNPSGVAIGFETKEVGDLSGLKTPFESVDSSTFEVFTNLPKGNGPAVAKFSTGLGRYVKWTVQIEETSNGFKLTSTSKEGFGFGASTTSACELVKSNP